MVMTCKLLATAGAILIIMVSDSNAQGPIYTGRSNGTNVYYDNGYRQNYYSSLPTYSYPYSQCGNTVYLNSSYNNGNGSYHSNYGPQYTTMYYQNSGMIYNTRRSFFGSNRQYSSPTYSDQTIIYQTYPGQSYYSTVPSVSVTPVTYSEVSTSSLLPATLVSQTQNQNATIKVMVPTMETQILFEGTLMTQTGMERCYQSTALESGVNYHYTVTARWTNSKGKSIEQDRKVSVQAGITSQIDFRSEMVIPMPVKVISR